METKIDLVNPIDVDGRKVSQLVCDPELLTVDQFAAAALAAKRKSPSGAGVVVQECDYVLHFYLAAYAAIAVDPKLDVTDIERVHGRDIVALTEVGRFFTLRSEGSKQETSEEPCATTQENSQPPSES